MSDEGKKRKKISYRLKADTVIAVSAVIISLCALVISIIETRVMRQQQQVAVYPHLDLDFEYSNEGYSITLSNKGQGMAFVENVQIWYKDKYFTDWKDIADYFLPEGHQISYSIYFTNSVVDEILSPDEEVILFKIPWSESSRSLVEQHFPKLSMEICYCSIMDECWSLNSQAKRPQLGSCTNDSEIQFN